MLNTLAQGGSYSVASVPEVDILAALMYSANKGDIPKTFDKIAESLTNAIGSGPQTLEHRGTVYRTEVYMRVDWQWLIYPISLLLLVSASTAYIAPHALVTLTRGPGNHLPTNVSNALSGAQPHGLEVLQHRHAVPRPARLAERSFCARARGRHGERC